jgi:cytochrome oxidase assembly protein ShyY1
VARTRNDDRGFEIITPMYTKVDQKSGDFQGLFVNRGRIPDEYRYSRMHLTPPNEEQEIEGVLMYSERDEK